jgi:hypothetical protein
MAPHDALLARMEEIDERLIAANDERQHFHGAYLRSTRSVLAEAEAGGFRDGQWAERWGIAFAELYLNAFDAWEAGEETPGPWRVAFEASQDPDLTPFHHALVGINAHINYDLPQALLAVITDEEFEDERVLALRAADHNHVDTLLVRRVPEEDRRMALVEEPGDRTLVDRLMKPFNRAGTKRFLKDGRKKVWRNTHILSRARRRGPQEYDAQLARLESLCQERIADLLEPRFVIVRLAIRGFGVELPEPEGV